MKAYIAGPLCTEKQRKYVENIAQICENLGIKTFLPHRDCGIWKSLEDTEKIAKGDLNGFNGCDFLIANLNGFNIGAGTAWEMGYAYALNVPVIGIKTDKNVKDCIEELSAIIVGTTKIVDSFDNLKKEIKKLLKIK